MYILVIQLVFKFLGSLSEAHKSSVHYSNPSKTEAYVKPFPFVSKLRQAVNGNDS